MHWPGEGNRGVVWSSEGRAPGPPQASAERCPTDNHAQALAPARQNGQSAGWSLPSPNTQHTPKTNMPTGNASALNRIRYLVTELGKVQDALGGGYLSAFPAEHFDRLQALQQVWAPYYVVGGSWLAGCSAGKDVRMGAGAGHWVESWCAREPVPCGVASILCACTGGPSHQTHCRGFLACIAPCRSTSCWPACWTHTSWRAPRRCGAWRRTLPPTSCAALTARSR